MTGKKRLTKGSPTVHPAKTAGWRRDVNPARMGHAQVSRKLPNQKALIILEGSATLSISFKWIKESA
jgi:hypothetical protein